MDAGKKNNVLKVSLVQMDVVWESVSDNLQKAESLISNNQYKADLIILPEMFSTGFSMNSKQIASSMDDEAVSWMIRISKEQGAVVMGSVSIEEEGAFYNRFIAAFPNGRLYYYDKRHLFRMTDEHNFYSPGNQRGVVNINGWRFALFVCYDIRFPVWCRNRNDYDVAVYVANWPDKRSNIWTTLLAARAIENSAYVIGVNRVGKDKNANYNGKTMIVDYQGTQIAMAPDETETIVNHELDLSKLDHFRNKFPVWLDADDFSIIS